MAEQNFYSDKDVLITSARAVFNGTTFALANVTSVRPLVQLRSWWVVILGGVLVFAGVALLVTATTLGLLSAALGAILMAVFFVLLKDKYCVCLVTAGAEVRAYWSTEAPKVEKIISALNAAIVHRG